MARKTLHDATQSVTQTGTILWYDKLNLI
jgi:hypothetical protein